MQEQSLQGYRILIAEDNFGIALHMADIVESVGCFVVGPARTPEEAEALARSERLNGALLDVDLGTGSSYGAADLARAQGAAVIFTTGYDLPPDMPEHLHDAPRLTKPIVEAHLKRLLRQVAGQGV